MRFLITTNDDREPFLTSSFDFDNHFDIDAGMVIFDLSKSFFTRDGIIWETIELDEL